MVLDSSRGLKAGSAVMLRLSMLASQLLSSRLPTPSFASEATVHENACGVMDKLLLPLLLPSAAAKSAANQLSGGAMPRAARP